MKQEIPECKFKVGDVVYSQYWDGTIGRCVVRGFSLQKGNSEDGQPVYYYDLEVGKYTTLEDYNVLDEDDPLVIEFKKSRTKKYKLN